MSEPEIIHSDKYPGKNIYIWPEIGYWIVAETGFEALYSAWLAKPQFQTPLDKTFLGITQDITQRKGINADVNTAIKDKFTTAPDHEDIAFTQTGLVVSVTNKCNMLCPYCYAESTPQNNTYLNPQKAKESIKICATHHFRSRKKLSMKVSFVGGEPFLHPDIIDLVHAAYKNGYLPSITTNGTVPLSKELLEKLKSYSCELNFSIDGPKQAIHALTRSSDFTRITTSIKDAVSCGIITHVSCFVHKGNIDLLEEYIATFTDLGVRGINFNTLNHMGRGLAPKGFNPVFNDTLYSRLFEIISRSPARKQILKGNSFFSTLFIVANCISRVDCGVSQESFFMDEHGDIYICGALKGDRFKINKNGEIQLSKLNTIAKSLEIENITECNGCAFAYFCSGSCRGEVLAYGQDIYTKKHPNCELIKKYLIEMMFALSEDDSIIQ